MKQVSLKFETQEDYEYLKAVILEHRDYIKTELEETDPEIAKVERIVKALDSDHIHQPDQFDHDETDRGHCSICGLWYDVRTGEIEESSR